MFSAQPLACVPSRTPSRPPLEPFEASVLDRVDGVRTIGQIAESVALGPHEVFYLLIHLESLGAVELHLEEAS